MAALTPTISTNTVNRSLKGVTIATWTPITLVADTFTAVELPNRPDRSVQITGTFDGGTVLIKGSIDGTNYVTLTDPQGNALSFTSAGLEAISELVRYIKPACTVAGAATSLTVSIMMRG